MGPAAHRRTADRTQPAHPLVQPLRPARAHGPRRRAIARPRARPTTVISTWACSTSTDGPSAPLASSATSRPSFGLCQWFHFEDHRLDDAVRWMKDLGVTYLRTGLSWADWFRPDASAWFDRQMRALEPFDVTVTFCFTPEDQGIWAHYTARPREPEDFAEFCAPHDPPLCARPARARAFGRRRLGVTSDQLTILSVAYPLAPTGPDAVGGAEQILTAIDAALVAEGHRSLVIACRGSRAFGELIEVPAIEPGRAITPEMVVRVDDCVRRAIATARAGTGSTSSTCTASTSRPICLRPARPCW